MSGPENMPPFLSLILSCPGSSVNKNPYELRPQAMSTARRRWGSRFHNRCRDLVGEENGPKNNAAAAAAVLCGFRRTREKRERGRDRPPHLNTTTEFVSRESVVDSSNLRLDSSSPGTPSSLLLSFSPSRRATSFWGGPKSLGVLPWRGKGIYRCCWGMGVSMGVRGSAEWWWGRTLTKPMSEDFSRKH